MTTAARKISAGELDVVQEILTVVDRRGKELEQQWGIGRLPALVPLEWTERFLSQRQKFSAACAALDCHETRKHGEAMLRAFDKLEALAIEAGHKPGPPDQWEFEVDGEVVILVKDIARLHQADTGGRRCQVWSLDEIANVIRSQKLVVEAKLEFAGAEVVMLRPVKPNWNDLNDEIPF